MATNSLEIEPSALLLSGYLLERKLGSGGMGEVWLARAPSGRPGLPSAVVIKRLHAKLCEDDRALRRFLDEARLAQLLHHPNVVELYEVGEADGSRFMAMELVDGLHLGQCLQACGTALPAPLAAAIAAEACAGLDYAHRLADEQGRPLNLVHRDIAPDNVMVDRRGRVKLVDFGIARTANTDLTTKAGDRRGKVRYVSPEYLRGEEATARSDVYSMGTVLFEMCTGTKPFADRKGIIETAEAIIAKGLPPADSLSPELPAGLAAIIAQAAQREPSRRFASAGELELALRRFLKNYVPPTPSQIGRDVAIWMQRLGKQPAVASQPEPPAAPAQPPRAAVPQTSQTSQPARPHRTPPPEPHEPRRTAEQPAARPRATPPPRPSEPTRAPRPTAEQAADRPRSTPPSRPSEPTPTPRSTAKASIRERRTPPPPPPQPPPQEPERVEITVRSPIPRPEPEPAHDADLPSIIISPELSAEVTVLPAPDGRKKPR